jgi:hypothetical protein
MINTMEGFPVEVQFLLKELYAVKKGPGHKNYKLL